MTKTPVWKSIATELTDEIAAGHYGTGDKLPTEANLAGRFGVNRHTVRHALKFLADQGLVNSRRGAGVFVSSQPTQYPIGRRVRFHQNVTAAGRTPERQVLRTETRPCGQREADSLRVNGDSQVHVFDGLSLADGAPIAVFRSVFPAGRFPDLLRSLIRSKSVTTALADAGVLDYTRLSTLVDARLASATQALHLKIREGEPILRTTSVNIDADGQPVEYGTAWFAANRVTLTFNND